MSRYASGRGQSHYVPVGAPGAAACKPALQLAAILQLYAAPALVGRRGLSGKAHGNAHGDSHVGRLLHAGGASVGLRGAPVHGAALGLAA